MLYLFLYGDVSDTFKDHAARHDPFPCSNAARTHIPPVPPLP